MSGPVRGAVPRAVAAAGTTEHTIALTHVKAGFTPMKALQAATLEPARFLGLERSLGTIEPGKIADLVVLQADPLADIGNTTQIDTVLARGRLISAERRTHMLADVEQAARDADATASATM